MTLGCPECGALLELPPLSGPSIALCPTCQRLRLKTRLHRFIDELGRWSNVDVFTVAIFIPLIRFGDLASSRAAPGSMAFTLVVFLTMIASRVFDPRLMWDAAERGAR